MSQNQNDQTPQEPRWHRLERGSALMEYWPTIPVGVAVMVVASALLPIMTNSFQKTADGLTGIECEVPQPTGTTGVNLDGGHTIEMSSYVYDPDDDRTTISFTVTSGSQPSISHWVLGIDEETAGRIVSSTEAYESWGQDPTTGKFGIKFDTGYEGGSGGGNPNNDGGSNGGNNDNSGGNSNGNGKGKNKASADTGLMLASYGGSLQFVSYSAAQTSDGETRTIVLTLSGNVTFERTEVTTKAGSSQVSTGEISTPATSTSSTTPDGDC